MGVWFRRGLTQKVEDIVGNSIPAVGTARVKTLTRGACLGATGADRRPVGWEPSESGGPERGQDKVRWGLRATVRTLDFA